VVFIANRS